MESKKSILKKAMSVKYCGSTRFDFLDEDEVPLILKAMEEYKNSCIEDAIKEIEELRIIFAGAPKESKYIQRRKVIEILKSKL